MIPARESLVHTVGYSLSRKANKILDNQIKEEIDKAYEGQCQFIDALVKIEKLANIEDVKTVIYNESFTERAKRAMPVTSSEIADIIKDFEEIRDINNG